jgi:hypothetical protein
MKFLKKRPILIPLILVISILLGLILLPISTLNPDVYSADKLMQGEYKELAIKQYQSAEKIWPILKVNLDFRNKYKKAEMVHKEYFDKKAAITVFLKDQTPDNIKDQFIADLKRMDLVKDIKYISQEEALKAYKKQNENSPELLELVTANILPASIEVYLSDWAHQNELTRSIRENPVVDTVISTPLP